MIIFLIVSAAAVLGLLLAVGGLWMTLRKKWLFRGVPILLLGLFLAVAGTIRLRDYRQALSLLESDFTADADRFQQLEKADLAHTGKPSGADWAQWRGPQRDGRSSETGLLQQWPMDGPPVLWRQPIGGGYSSPVVAGGQVYCMDKQAGDERVLCLAAGDGKLLWEYRYPADYAGMAYRAGPRATPTVHDGKVYTVGATGVFLCLDAKAADSKPALLWRHDLQAEFRASPLQWGIACSPLVEGNLVIVQPGGDKGSIVAFDRISGKLVWSALSETSGYSSPVAATAAGVRQIICFTGHGMTGLRPDDGSQLWYFAWPTQYNCNVATPIIAGDYVFLSSNYQAGCALLYLTATADGVKAEPIYVRRDKLMRNHFGTCVLHQDHLYGFDISGHGGDGYLKCIDLKSAQEKWTTRSFQKGNVLFADGRLFVLAQDGQLGLVEATPASFKSVGRFRALQGSQCWAVPALAGGRLYVRDSEEIACFNLRK